MHSSSDFYLFCIIFSLKLYRKIKKTRENFDYKLSQPSRGIKDYVEYLKYERGLMATTKERIKQNKVITTHSILIQIADRMKKLYANALSKFTNNIRFWDEYIKFLQTFKYTKDISSAFDRMLQVGGYFEIIKKIFLMMQNGEKKKMGEENEM